MPRVAHVISTPEGVGGAEQIVAALVRGAPAHGWEPTVLNPFGRQGPDSALAGLCAPATVEAHPCDRPWGLPGLRRWLGRRLRELDADIVHAHLFHAAVAVAAVRVPSGTRTVLTHHHGDHLVYTNKRLRARLDRWAGRRYDRVVAISDAMRAFLRNAYRYPGDRIVLIRNGWEGTPKPHVGAERPTVVCVANFRRQKGHLELLDAFAALRRDLPEAQLVLVGDGELRERIAGRVTALGLDGAVAMRGSADVWVELARADVFALASLYEPLGIAVIEAMAAGLPVVASRVGGIPELVEEGVTGRLVAPEDPPAMAAALRATLTTDTRAMGEAGRARAAELPMSATVTAYYRLYDELIAGRE